MYFKMCIKTISLQDAGVDVGLPDDGQTVWPVTEHDRPRNYVRHAESSPEASSPPGGARPLQRKGRKRVLGMELVWLRGILISWGPFFFCFLQMGFF